MILDIRVAIGALVGSHLVRDFWTPNRDIVIASELESIRAQLRELTARAAQSEAEAAVCEWKVWKSDFLFRATVLLDLLLVFGLCIWWFPLRKESAGAVPLQVVEPVPERDHLQLDLGPTVGGPVTPKRIKAWQQQA